MTWVLYQNMREWEYLWKLKIYERLNLMLWKIAWDILPTKDTLNKRRPQADMSCVLCNQATESVNHFFVSCPYTTISFGLSLHGLSLVPHWLTWYNDSKWPSKICHIFTMIFEDSYWWRSQIHFFCYLQILYKRLKR